jgi:CRP-like cAMP-binding protein
MIAPSSPRELAAAAISRHGPAAGAPLAAALKAAMRLGREARFREGRALFYQGDGADAAYLILEGGARRVQYSTGGKPVELPPVEPGDWAGLPELVAGVAHPCDALAEGPCLALAFSLRGYRDAAAEPAFAAHAVGALARSALTLHAFLADESPAERLAAFLLARRPRGEGASRDANGPARVDATQDRIARAIGVTRETVNKRLAELESRGLLRTLRGGIEVLDWKGLAGERDRGG